MKAAVYDHTGGPEVFYYTDMPDPVCRPNGIVLEIKAISIEGGDVVHRAGGPMATTPHIVGYQAAGIVGEIGERVREIKVGDRVVVTVPYGSHAEKLAVGARGAWRVPDGLDLRVAACVPIPFGTADDCLFLAGRLQPGETVLVQGGAGGVGLATIQLAKRAGATVIATASSESKLERLRAFGMDHGINYVERDLVSVVREITDGRGVDVAVDPVGSTLEASLAALAFRGRAVTVGNMSRSSTLLDVRPLLSGNKSLHGVFFGSELGTERGYDIVKRHLADVASGALKVVIDREFPLAEAGAAHAYIESRQAFGRVLLIP